MVPTSAEGISATHQNMEALVKVGTFREDLYFRLAVLKITLPPLRDRGEDVVALAQLEQRRAALHAQRGAGRVLEGRDRVERLHLGPREHLLEQVILEELEESFDTDDDGVTATAAASKSRSSDAKKANRASK